MVRHATRLYRVVIERTESGKVVRKVRGGMPKALAQAVAEGFNLAERKRPAGLRAVVKSGARSP